MAGKTAVFDGDAVVLEETDWYLLDLFGLWWRYGISFLRLQMWVEEIMEKFMRWVVFSITDPTVGTFRRRARCSFVCVCLL